MSAIFSDPPFRRGTALCSGDLTGTGTGTDAPGYEIIGQVKAFQDVVPTTGKRNSNRLVYCVAVRWTASSVTDASTVAGTVYTFSATAPLSEVDATAATSSLAAGTQYGVLDEYLTGNLTQNDVVWMVVKGPTSAKRTATAITTGATVVVSATAGSVAVTGTNNAGTLVLGQACGGDATGSSHVRVNLDSDSI